MMEPQIVLQNNEGYHNSLDYSINQKKNAYKDLSTICIVPTRGQIPAKVVQNWMGLMTPMNQKFIRLFAIGLEVGKAYDETIKMIINHPELSKWKYILTLEEDNCPPPDGLLKLYESMDEYDAVGGLYWTKGIDGKPMCFDDQTEVLTSNGWKLFKDVINTDLIATINDIGYLEYFAYTDKQEYHYTGEMIHWQGQSYDLMVTPDHSVYCSKRETSIFKREKASDVENKSRIRFKKNCDWEGKEQEFFYINENRKVKMDDWLELIGYYISEGSCPRRESLTYDVVDIRQYKQDIYEKINNVCNRLSLNTKPMKGRIHFKDKEIRNLLLPLGYSGDKYVPDYIKQLSKRQITIFLKALWDGDGSKKSARFENYYSKSKKLADDVQILLLKIGLVGTIGKNRTNYVVSTSHSNMTPIMMKKPKRQTYDGIVYDLTVPPNHTLYVRRNGKSMWSGNCYGNPNALELNFVPFMPTDGQVTRCNGLGMGFTLFKLDMFKNPNLPNPIFETVQRLNPNGSVEGYTQDLKFFENAGKLGYKFACDPRVKVGHYDIFGDTMW